ncbi:MAG: FG-GAP-like repeat-containing protein, partial [Thermodesulfobacteriota bacterium]
MRPQPPTARPWLTIALLAVLLATLLPAFGLAAPAREPQLPQTTAPAPDAAAPWHALTPWDAGGDPILGTPATGTTTKPADGSGKTGPPERPTAGLELPDREAVQDEALKDTDSPSSPATATAAATTGAEAGAAATPMLAPPQVMPNTGALTYRVPITVPPGRGGIAPNLALVYNSSARNGWLGVGWSLDMGSIQRSTKKGLDYSRNDYVAVVDGAASELVQRPDLGTGFYGAKIEGGFSIYYRQNGGFVQLTKDGMKYSFGTSAAAREFDPADASKVFKWNLEKVEDANGNYMTISYVRKDNALYLSEIKYTGHPGGTVNGSTVAALDPTNSVKFILETAQRPDPMVSWHARFEMKTAYRLDKIRVLVNDVQTREYDLTYETSASTGRSVLNAVQEFGADGTAMPALALDWFDNADAVMGAGLRVPFAGGRERLLPASYPGDFNGDGKADLLVVTYSELGPAGQRQYFIFYQIAKSNDDGTLSLVGEKRMLFNWNVPNAGAFITGDFNGDGYTDLIVNEMTRISSGDCVSFSDVSSWLPYSPKKIAGDFNGDGLDDILCFGTTASQDSIYLSNGDGTFRHAFSIGFGQGYTIGDYNGDGRMDFIVLSGGAWQLYLANQNGTFSWSSSLFSDQYWIVSGDFNGDGLHDIFVNSSMINSQVDSSKGNGEFALAWSGPGFTSVQPGDFNGDGSTDLAAGYYNYGNVHMILSANGDGSLSMTQSALYGTPIGTADPNGDGKSDVIIRYDDYSQVVQLANTIEGGANDLLSAVHGPHGGTATIRYQPSSAFQNRLQPFITQTVASVTLDDGYGNLLTTSYAFEGGYFDAADREYRGFEHALQTNPDGTEVSTCFYVGDPATRPGAWTCANEGNPALKADSYLKGRPYLTQTWAPDGSANPMSRIELVWDKKQVSGDAVFVKLKEKRSQAFDATGKFLETLEEYTYDLDTIPAYLSKYFPGYQPLKHGGLLASRTTDVAPGRDGSITRISKHANYGNWVWRVTEEVLTTDPLRDPATASAWLRKTTHAYETGTGNKRFDELWLEGGTNPKVEYRYTEPRYEYGNVTRVIDARGNPTTTDFDAATHTYPVKVTNALGHFVERGEIDYRYGKPSWEKDANGNRTDFQYDGFGRVRFVNTPDGGSTETVYGDQFPPYVVTKVSEDASRTVDSCQYFDGLGRPTLAVRIGTEAGDTETKYITTRLRYDSMGRQYQVEGPYAARYQNGLLIPLTNSYPRVITYFDYRGRPSTVSRTDSSGGTGFRWLTTTFTYEGLSTTVEDADLRKKKETRDFLGRLVEVVEDPGPGKKN